MLSHIRTIDLFFFLKKLIALNWRGEGSYTMYSRFLARPEAPPSVILYVKETTILTRNPSRRFYFAIPHPKELTYRFQRGEYYTRSSSVYFYIQKMTYSFDVEKKTAWNHWNALLILLLSSYARFYEILLPF